MGSSNKILLITALPPAHSAGLGQNIINALTQAGYEVDVLTKYRYLGQPIQVKNVKRYPFKQEILKTLRRSKFVMSLVAQLKKIINFSESNGYIQNNGIAFTYPDEYHPQVSPELLISKITGQYKAVITLFWQGFINSQSLKAVYNKLKCPIIIYSVDMAPMTGGCHYFGDCRRLYDGCGKCPALNSSEIEDASRRNFEIKKSNYSQMNCVYLANTWMNRFAQKTGLFNNNQIKYASIVLDKDKFSPAKSTKDKFLLSDEKRFVIMFRSSIAIARKGDSYVAEMMNKLYEELTPENRKRILLLSVGSLLGNERKEALRFDVKDLGLVSEPELIKAYRTTSIFISASTDDAGPSMVNQSMMCGTPVAAFNVGTAIDSIQNNINGFIAPLGDVDPWVTGIKKMIQDEKFQESLSKEARLSAIRHNSYEVFATSISSLIHEFGYN